MPLPSGFYEAAERVKRATGYEMPDKQRAEFERLSATMAKERAEIENAWLSMWMGILFPGKDAGQLKEITKTRKIHKRTRSDRPRRIELWIDDQFIAFIEIVPNFQATPKPHDRNPHD